MGFVILGEMSGSGVRIGMIGSSKVGSFAGVLGMELGSFIYDHRLVDWSYRRSGRTTLDFAVCWIWAGRVLG